MTTQTIDRAATHARSRRVPDLVTGWLVPLALAALALALYRLTRSEVHTFDALSYVRDVDQRAGFFFHPHHPLYSPTGWLFYKLWQAFGYGGSSEIPLQVLNSVVGAAIGVGLYRLVLRRTGRWWAAFLAAGILLFNYGFWYFAVEVEVYHLALVWLIAALALLIELVTQPRRRTAPLLGLALGLAALYHQTNGLLVPVVIAGVLLSPVAWRERLTQLITAGVISAAVVAIGYALVGFGYNGFRSLGEMRAWMFFFIETGWWGHAVRDRLTDLGAGLGNTISTEGALIFWVAIVIVLLVGLPAAVRRWPRISVISLIWIAIYGGFFAWWEADNIEFWIGTLLPLWLLLGLSLDRAAARVAVSRVRQIAPALPAFAIALPLLLAWHNYPLVHRRGDASQDLQRQLSAAVRERTAPADLIVSPGGVMELYLPYYEDRHNVSTLNGILFETNGDLEAAFERLRDRIDTSLHAGLTVIVGQDVLAIPQDIFMRYPVTQADLDRFWAPYMPALEPAVIHNGTTYFWRVPPATELATQGWRWASFALGWQPFNVERESFDGSWCFDPAVDPALVSPRLNLDATRIRAVEVTLRTAAAGESAQLFWAGPDESMSDEQSVVWPIEGDGMSHSYTIPLAGESGWSGTITRLRLDPIAIGDGTDATRTCVESMRLVP
jgi:4-amino-4-deoxy-L-arabinose transferase-like glycosyltransferase